MRVAIKEGGVSQLVIIYLGGFSSLKAEGRDGGIPSTRSVCAAGGPSLCSPALSRLTQLSSVTYAPKTIPTRKNAHTATSARPRGTNAVRYAVSSSCIGLSLGLHKGRPYVPDHPRSLPRLTNRAGVWGVHGPNRQLQLVSELVSERNVG